MQDRGSLRFVPPTLVLAAGLSLAAIGGWQSGCDRPDHGLVEVQQGDCYTCHVGEYEDPANLPPHMTAFATLSDPTACAQCHLTPDPAIPDPDGNPWTPAVMPNHPFPLENGHAGRACTDCHTTGYAPGQTSAACVSCHLDDYQTSPHGTSYSTECQNCHGTAGWLPASAHPETQFPIHSGPHAPYATQCASCHDASLGSYVEGANTNCIDCHDQAFKPLSELDGVDDHLERRCTNRAPPCYPVPSAGAPKNFCLDCHPRGLP